MTDKSKMQVMRDKLKSKLAQQKHLLSSQNSLELDLDILNQITHHENPYDKQIMGILGILLCRKFQFDEEKHFQIVQSFERSQLFEKLVNMEQNPIFVAYEGEGSNWIAMVIVKDSESKLWVLYTNPCPEIDNSFKTLQSSYKIDVATNDVNSKNSNLSGAIALKNLEIMMYHLKKNMNNFISNFSKFADFSKIEDVSQIKTNFKLGIIQPKIEDILEKLEITLESKNEIQNFVEFIVKTKKKVGITVDNYVKILGKELIEQEQNPSYKLNEEKIQKARGEMNSSLAGFGDDVGLIESTVKQMVPEFRRDSATLRQVEHNATKSDLSLTLQKFTFIFTLLKGTSETGELKELLGLISNKFGIKGEILLEFFRVEISKVDGDHSAEKDNDSADLNVLSVENLIKLLPSQKILKSDRKIKSLERLLAELAIEKELEEDEIYFYNESELSAFFKSKYNNNSKILHLEDRMQQVYSFFELWKDKDIPAIRNWAESKRISNPLAGNTSLDISESIAVMDRAFELITGGFRLRLPQILSILEFLSEYGVESGKLCQISTGEGKTIIIAVLTSIKVLQGEVVDVLTSNQVLAAEGVVDTHKFYSTFGISVSTNNVGVNETNAGNSIHKSKPCYNHDVVYGTISNFQFDYLRHSFEGIKTRGMRRFGYVILDEVDNLTIDNGSTIAKLAGPFPGMAELKYVYIKIWQELIKAETTLAKQFDAAKVKEAEKLKQKILSEQEIQSEYEQFQAKFLSEGIEKIKVEIVASNPVSIPLIPSHLQEYCVAMTTKWINNAIYAKYECNQNENYVIKEKDGENVIIPVDFENTGVTLKNTIWSDGLHQFVQLKHNLQLTTETLTTSFISNIGYIKLYKNKLYGMTGTLGSEAEKSLLSTAYKLTFSCIPRFKPNHLTNTESLVVRDAEWLNLVAMKSFVFAQQGNSVLIICKTIKDMRNLEKNIKAIACLEGVDGDQIKIKTYADEDGFKIVHEKVGPHEIIVATNIAGRGTDFKTTADLEEKGGLHVIVAFLPYNQRVQDQAFGRTARQGKSGTAQLILTESEILQLGIFPGDGEESCLTIEHILEKRDNLEKKRLDKIKKVKLMEIDFQDGIFTRFSELYNAFKKRNMEKVGGLFVVEDLKEFWGFWLHKNEFTGKTLVDIGTEFERFKSDAKNILEQEIISFNPYYSIRQAEYFIKHNKILEAETSIQNALSIAGKSRKFLYPAYLKLFEIQIEKGAQLMERFRKAVASVFFISVTKDDDYKEKASSALMKAVRALEHEISFMKTEFMEDSNVDFRAILVTQDKDNIFLKHLHSRHIALSTYHEHATSLLSQLEESSKNLGDNIGIGINSRIPQHLRQLDANIPDEKSLKDSLTLESLCELESVGLETIYALREVHDAHKEVIIGAQIQIGLGLSSLAAGIAFPPSLPVMGAIAGALISEGICDIVIELISRGGSGFNLAEYVKGKCISFGIALATMGIGAIATSTKVLDTAVKACKGLAQLLRKCPFLKGVCDKIATQLSNLGSYFEKLKHIAEFKKLRQIDQLQKLKEIMAVGDLNKFQALGGLEQLRQLEHLKELGKLDFALSRVYLLKSSLLQIGKQSLTSTVGSVIAERVVSATLNEILQSLQPHIALEVGKIIRSDLDMKAKLQFMKREDNEIVIHEILTGTYGDMAGAVLQEIALGILRHAGNWKAKVASITIDSVISLVKIGSCTLDFCEKFKATTTTKCDVENDPGVVSAMQNVAVTMVTGKMYSLLIQLSGKYANTFVVSPLLNKLTNFTSAKKLGVSKDMADEEAKSFAEIVEAYQTLGLKAGAGIDQIKQAFKAGSLNAHPDRPGGSHDKFLKLSNSYNLLNQLHSQAAGSSGASSSITHPLLLSGPNLPSSSAGFPPPLSFNSDTPRRPAHVGNISTISKELKVHIIVKHVLGNSETKLQEFGTNFKNKIGQSSLVVEYFPPTPLLPGHYAIPHEIAAKLNVPVNIIPSWENSCLYDSLVPQINSQRITGDLITTAHLQAISETTNFSNIIASFALKTSTVLKNPISQKLYLKATGALLVGGANGLQGMKLWRDGFTSKIKELDLAPPTETEVRLNDLCSNDPNAVSLITDNSPKFKKSGGIKPIKLYTIQNLDSLTSLILNSEYNSETCVPFAVRFPNGTSIIFTEELYALVAIGSDERERYLSPIQYQSENPCTVITAMQALTTADGKINLKLMPEVCGRLIAEAIRNKSTFVSTCLALIKDIQSPVAGTEHAYVTDNKNPLPVTPFTGIYWTKGGDNVPESDATDIKNPNFLLQLHINQAKTNSNIKNIYKVTKQAAQELKLLGESFNALLFENIFKKVKFLLGQDDYDPCP